MRRGTIGSLLSPGGIFGLIVVGTAVVCAGFASQLSQQNPFDLVQLSVADSQLPPGSLGSNGIVYWLGSDDQGRDIVSAILYGLRISLLVAIASTSIAFVLGTSIGLSAAYAGGWLDLVFMRLADIQLAFPGILIALVLLSVLGSGIDKVVIAIVAVQWAYYARTARSVAIIERSKEYILAAQSLRFSAARIIFSHLLPNSLSALSVVVIVQIAGGIALEATLSFLGMGLPITQPSLGLLIANGYTSMLSGEYWLSFYPGFVLLLLLVGINLIGERLRELNDPRESL
ncbi:MAG TPA: ABC transporter permease [Bradyrhizobium sp.]|nr:ABC transporter permease [Bradyrhizobium sp.]